jgi:hypothetical protein
MFIFETKLKFIRRNRICIVKSTNLFNLVNKFALLNNLPIINNKETLMKNKIYLIAIFLIGFVLYIYPQNLYRSGIFLHRSSGGVLWGGGGGSTSIPLEMDEYNTMNNYTGQEAITMDHVSFPSDDVPDNNWETWHALFAGTNYLDDSQALYQYIQNEKIVVIKSCWLASDIVGIGDPSDTLNIFLRTTYNYKWHFRYMLNVMKNYPNTFFVIMTSIPLVPGPSYDGSLTHEFYLWAKDTLATGNDPVFGNFPPNVYIFDAFHILAIENQTTQWGNAVWGMNPLYHDEGDNHPNGAGAEAVDPLYVQEIFDAAIVYEGGVTSVEGSSSGSLIPNGVELKQNYPNPFNPTTEINYTLAKSGHVTLKVYDSLGLVVATLVDGFMNTGGHTVKFDAKNFTSGIYIYQIETDNYTAARKMLLIK